MIATPLDDALVTLFTGDATLTALIPGGVWNGDAPVGTTRAYLVLSDPTEEPGAESFGTYGDTAIRRFDTWTPVTVKSPRPARAILDRIEILLRAPLVVAGHTSPIIRREFRTVTVDEDLSRHGQLRYRFTAAEVP